MSVAVIGTPAVIAATDAPTYTAETGSNRIVLLVVQHEDASGATNPLMGSEPFVDITADPNTGVQNTSVYAGYILEDDIPAGSQTVAMIETGMSWVNNTWAGTIYTLSGVDQAGPIDPIVLEESVSFATSFTSSNVTSVTDGYLFAGFSCSGGMNATPPTFTAGWTEDNFDNTENGGAWINHSKAITSGTSEGVTYTWTPSDSESGMFAMFGVAPADGAISDVNYSAANRGIMRGTARGVG